MQLTSCIPRATVCVGVTLHTRSVTNTLDDLWRMVWEQSTHHCHAHTGGAKRERVSIALLFVCAH